MGQFADNGWIPFAVLLALLAAGLTGCSSLLNPGSGPAAASGTPASIITPSPSPVLLPETQLVETPVSTIDIPAEALRGVLVRYWHPYTGSTRIAVEDLVEKFNLSNPWGILVTAVPFSGYDALDAALQAENQPAGGPNVLTGYKHQALAWEQSRPLLDLQPYVIDSEWGLSQAEIDDYYPIFWEDDLSGERRLGIPVYRSAQLLVYNQSWAKELGYTSPPESPEQFRRQVCSAAESLMADDLKENNGMGGWLISTDPAVSLSWLKSFSGSPLKNPAPAQGTSIYQFDTPESQQAFTYLRELYDQGCSWLPNDPVPDLAIANRQALIAAASLTDLPFIAEALQQNGNQDRWTVLPFPSENQSLVVYLYGPSFLVFQGEAKQQLAAWLFIRWMASPENIARIIETNGAYPVRKSTLDQLQGYAKRYPQWDTAIGFLEYAQNEPGVSSWGAVRRSLGDAATQLYRSYFTVEQVGSLLQYLDAFAAELHLGIDLQSVFATITPTPPPPTRTPFPTSTPVLEPSQPAASATP